MIRRKGDLYMIIIGIDPHMKTHTAVAVDAVSGRKLGERTVSCDKTGHESLLAWARALDTMRYFAIEDCRQVSGRLERHLLPRGERVVRVPPKMMAGTRSSARTYGKSDPIDAECVARAALRQPDLPAASLTGPEHDVRLLVDHRDDLVGETAGASRFSGEAAFAMHVGTAPLPVSSGKSERHRLNRTGNRRLNSTIHMIAVTQARMHPPAIAFMERKRSEGMSSREALRCLKRHLTRVVFKTMLRAEQSRCGQVIHADFIAERMAVAV